MTKSPAIFFAERAPEIFALLSSLSRDGLKPRSDGRYCCKYKDHRFYGDSAQAAYAARDKYVLSDFLNGETADTASPDGTTRFYDFALRIWLPTYRTECGERQYRQYESLLKFAAEALGNKPISEIGSIELQTLINQLRNYSTSYVRKFVATLRGVFESAEHERLIERNPMFNVKMPKCKEDGEHRELEKWERQLIYSTYREHDFGLAAMVMLLAGLRRGEALYLDVDRDVDFKRKKIYVRGAVTFVKGNQASVSAGKTKAALREIDLCPALEEALRGHHGLLCTKADGGLMTETAFSRKYDSYIFFLETKLNGVPKRWYGKTKEHKKMLAEGKELPPWRDVTIRCHDLRVSFCSMCYYAGVKQKTLMVWMGHSDAQMIMRIYTKLSDENAVKESMLLGEYATSYLTGD